MITTRFPVPVEKQKHEIHATHALVIKEPLSVPSFFPARAYMLFDYERLDKLITNVSVEARWAYASCTLRHPVSRTCKLWTPVTSATRDMGSNVVWIPLLHCTRSTKEL